MGNLARNIDVSKQIGFLLQHREFDSKSDSTQEHGSHKLHCSFRGNGLEMFGVSKQIGFLLHTKSMIGNLTVLSP